jgi:hypothetical protein
MKRDFRMASLSSYHSPRSLWIASAHACRHHLADLKAAGHSPRSTELHNPSDGGAPVRVRLFRHRSRHRRLASARLEAVVLLGDRSQPARGPAHHYPDVPLHGDFTTIRKASTSN